jgi:hypothetical protein
MHYVPELMLLGVLALVGFAGVVMYRANHK